MRYITRIKRILRNHDGEIMFGTLFRALFAIAFIGAVVAYLQLDLMATEVKHTLKQEANTLSAAIAADTYDARIQSNLAEYENQLLSSLSYREHLLNTTVDAIVADLGLIKAGSRYLRTGANGATDFYLTDFALQQHNQGNRIRYTIQCTITIPFPVGGSSSTGFSFPVSYDTYHIFKQTTT